MKVLKFDPRNKFAEDIIAGRKRQTIRPKPIEVGTDVALWEMWRGMHKCEYCPDCFIECEEKDKECPDCHLDEANFVLFPRKLLNTTITDCVPIEMEWDEEDNVLDIWRRKYLEAIEPNSPLGQSEFVAKDTPSWSNKKFVEFFLKTYPDISKKRVAFWIWRWEL